MEVQRQAYARPAGDGTVIQGPAGGLLTFKARGVDTGGALTALENVIAPGDGPPLHVHDREEEAWHITEGRFRFQLGDTIAEAGPGSFVFVPRGTPHCFQNVGELPASLFVLFTPAGMERFFEDFAALGANAGPEAFAEIGERYGMRVVGPPLGAHGAATQAPSRGPAADDTAQDPVRFGL